MSEVKFTWLFSKRQLTNRTERAN